MTIKILAATSCIILAVSTAPASACHWGGCGYGYYGGDDAAIALGAGALGMIAGMAIAGAAQSAAQQQYAAPVCYAPNGSPYYARAWRGRWRC
jgi:hypothetical protein